MQAEIQTEEQLHLEGVHFIYWYTSNFCVVGIVEVLVVKKLGCEHNARNNYSMNIKCSQSKIIHLDKAVNVNQGEYEAFIATASIFMDSLKIVIN